MRKKIFSFLDSAALAAALIFSLALISTAQAGQIIEGDTGDGMVTPGTVNSGAFDNTYQLLVGGLNNNQTGTMVEAFALPYLAPGQTVTAATISFYVEGFNSQYAIVPTFNLQLYGLNRVSTTSPLPLPADFYQGNNDTANTLLDGTFITPAIAANSTATYSGSNLASFVQKQYTNAAFSGLDLSSGRYIFFRLNADALENGTNNYIMGNARNANRTIHPTLALTISNGISNIAGRLQFSFNLPQASITSAGVYNTSTGALIRTIWNNVQYQAGMNYGVWDGNDDSGAAVAAGTNYQIKMIYHNVAYVWEGMIGNTSTNQTGSNVYHSFLPMVDMAVAGTHAYYSVGYNENEVVFHQFTVGTPQVPSEVVPLFTDSNAAFVFVAADSTKSYWTKCAGGLSPQDTFVIAINNASNTVYNFPKGTVPTNQSYLYTSCVDFDTTANQPNSASGIAVQQTGNDLFVAHGNLNLVRVFDKVQGTLLGSFSVTNPSTLATTANGDVWVLSNGTTPVISRYTFANGAATLKESITGLVAPNAMSVSADDSVLVVADSGTSQQIKAFNNATGAPAWTFGLAGGMETNGPAVTTNCFDFSNGSFVAFQPDNTFWIRDGGNSRVMHYSITDNSLTYIEQIAYLGASYRATVDLSDATRVFNQFYEYKVNYAVQPGGTNGSWTLVNNWLYGLPNDATHAYTGYANGFTNVVTLPNGRTYGLLGNTITEAQDLYELPATGPARNTGYSYVNNPRIYPDGTFRFNTSSATTLSFYSEPLTGYNTSGDPVWGSPALIASTPHPATAPQMWPAYPERTEVTAGGIVANFDGNFNDTGYHLGGVPLHGTAWQWLASPSRTTNGLWFPQDGKFDIVNGVQYAGNLDMALGRNIVYGYHGEFWGGGEASQWVNFYDNGLMVGRFGTYADASMATSKAIDGFSGNAFSPTLVHAPNGKVYLYHNDESNHSGTGRWRIDGWDGITTMQGTGAVGGIVSLSASTAGPTVTITSPTASALYSNGSNVTFAAEVGGSGAAITSVQFLDGTTSLGSVAVPPYNLTYSGLAPGTHVITAKATDSTGASGTSATVTITIASDGTGTTAPPPAPTGLAAGTVAAQSVPLTWTEPNTGTTSSSIGQILSFQMDAASDSNALAPATVAGVAPYAAANFNELGQTSTNGLTLINVVNSSGTSIPNLGTYLTMGWSGTSNSTKTLTGSQTKLFGGFVNTLFSSANAISISNIPYANYDLVVYSLPGYIGSDGNDTAAVTLSNSMGTSVVQQKITKIPTGFTLVTVPFGTSTSTTDINTIVFQGLTAQSFELQGLNVCAFQIVERPFDQGTPTSYTIERASSASGPFTVVGTVTAPATSFTDTSSSLVAGTTYVYKIAAVNGTGASTFSNVVTVTTPAAVTPPVVVPPVVIPPVVIPPVTTPTTGTVAFSSWLTSNFTAAQLADSTITGPNADPFGSGVPNLLAYALGLNPSTAQLSNVPTPVPVNGHLQVTYVAPSSVTGINYIVEVSPDLATWSSGTGYTTTISSVAGTSGTTVTVQDTLPTSTPKHFMRLRVTQQ